MLSTSDYVLIGLKDGVHPEELLNLLGGLVQIQPLKIEPATSVLASGMGWDGSGLLYYSCLQIIAVAPRYLFSPKVVEEHSDKLSGDKRGTNLAVELLLYYLEHHFLDRVVSTYERGSLGVVRTATTSPKLPDVGNLTKPGDPCIALYDPSNWPGHQGYFPRWYLKAIHAEADDLRPYNLQTSTLGEGITVAILDSGIDRRHPQLGHQRVLSGIRLCQDDQDRPPSDLEDQDYNGHGTEVAGIINAMKKDGYSLEGIAGACTIVPIKVLRCNDEEPNCISAHLYEIVDGIEYCCENHISIACMSIGDIRHAGVGYNTILEQAASNFDKTVGGILIAASGDKHRVLSTWAQCPSVVCVGSAVCSGTPDCTYKVASDSGFSVDNLPPDQGVELCAPGCPLCLTTEHGQQFFKIWGGTSFSCPHVAAAAAALAAKHQQFNLSSFREAIKRTCTPITQTEYDGDQRYVDNASGSGLLNLCALLTSTP
jgi:subtilisin family serine protease